MKNKHTFQTEERANGPVPAQTRPPRRILLAHDDCDIRELSTELLIRSGYQVDAAANGAAAWQALNAVHYDLLITGHEMPEVSGIVLLGMLHAVGSTLPVIMAATILPWREFSRYPWLQPAAMLAMPYTVEEFLGTVEEILLTADGTRNQTRPFTDLKSQSTTRG